MSETNMVDQETGPNLIAKQYDDKQRQSSIELALSEAETRLRLNSEDLTNLTFTRSTLVALRNFMNKYSKMKDEMPYVENAIDRFEENPLLWIESLNDYMFDRFHSVYGFGLPSRTKKDWKLTVLERLQIEDKLAYNDPVFDSIKLNPKHNRLLRQDSYIDNWYVTKTNNDLLELYGGVRGQGKSTAAIWKMLYMFEDRGETLSIKNIKNWFEENIIYTDEVSLGKKILELEDSILIVDEGFFSVHNLSSMEREVVSIAKNMNATRNRRNAYLLCMSDLSASTKPVQRLATGFYWIQRQGYLNKYVKSKNWVNSKDPLGLDEINKAKYDFNVSYLLTHHKFYVKRMRTTPLPDRWYKIYNDIKHKRQGEKAEKDELKKLNEKLDERMTQKAIDAYRAGDKDLMTWFAEQGMPKNIAKAYTKKAMGIIWRDQILEKEDLQIQLPKQSNKKAKEEDDS